MRPLRFRYFGGDCENSLPVKGEIAMSVTAGFMVPHPPLIIPEVGRGEQREIAETIEAYHRVGKETARIKPDTIVVISPHSILCRDYFHIRPDNRLTGDFSRFQAGQVSVGADCDAKFVEALCRTGEEKEMPWGTLGGGEEENFLRISAAGPGNVGTDPLRYWQGRWTGRKCGRRSCRIRGISELVMGSVCTWSLAKTLTEISWSSIKRRPRIPILRWRGQHWSIM